MTADGMSADCPIIDAHHHVWRQQDLSWLNGPMQPRIFGPYESIMRDYSIHEYIQDVDSTTIEKSVYVQANWPVEKAVDEVHWVQSCANESGWPHAIVGYCDLFSDSMGESLAAQAKASSLMRGVRMQLHWHEVPHYRFAPSANLMGEKKLQQNLAKIQDYGWLFELQLFSGQMNDGADLVRKFPGINFVIVHGGMPHDLEDKGYTAWEEGMRSLAANSNCYVKLSGLGTFTHCVSEADIARIAESCLQIFGEDRCVFGSNFPIEKIWSNFDNLMNAYQVSFSKYNADVCRKVFHDNAARLYKL